jgi:formate dehydrogenase subunit gamma
MNFISRVAGWLVLAIAFSTPALAQQAPATAPAKAAPVTAAPAAAAPAEDPIKVQQQRAVDQPGNNAPVWREVRSGQPNYTSIPGREVGVLVQPQARFPGQDAMTTAGEAWRKFRNGPITSSAAGW